MVGVYLDATVMSVNSSAAPNNKAPSRGLFLFALPCLVERNGHRLLLRLARVNHLADVLADYFIRLPFFKWHCCLPLCRSGRAR